MPELMTEAITRDPDLVTRQVDWQGRRITLRLLRPEDGERLGRYFQGLGPGTRNFYGPHPMTRDEARDLCREIDYGDTLRCLATSGQGPEEEVLAYFILVLTVREGDMARYANLGLTLDPLSDATLAPSVADTCQSSGLGSLVMPWVLDLARRLGKRRVVLMGGVQEANLRGRRFYQKFGFHKVGEFTSSGGAINNHDMILDLDAPDGGGLEAAF